MPSGYFKKIKEELGLFFLQEWMLCRVRSILNTGTRCSFVFQSLHLLVRDTISFLSYNMYIYNSQL